MKKCKVKGCENKHSCKGFCSKHYNHIKKYGKILKRTRTDKNEIIDCGSYCEIYLYNIRHQKVARAKIDKDDLGKIKKYKWSMNNGYVCCSSKKIKLHQLILDKKDESDIDHINHRPTDNRKRNLRHCTRSQNLMNKKVKGCYRDKRDKKWETKIMINYKSISLGRFKDKQEAITARRNAEQKYFKEFAYKYY